MPPTRLSDELIANILRNHLRRNVDRGLSTIETILREFGVVRSYRDSKTRRQYLGRGDRNTPTITETCLPPDYLVTIEEGRQLYDTYQIQEQSPQVQLKQKEIQQELNLQETQPPPQPATQQPLEEERKLEAERISFQIRINKCSTQKCIDVVTARMNDIYTGHQVSLVNDTMNDIASGSIDSIPMLCLILITDKMKKSNTIHCSFCNKHILRWYEYRLYERFAARKIDCGKIYDYMIQSGSVEKNFLHRQRQGTVANKLFIEFGPIVFVYTELFPCQVFLSHPMATRYIQFLQPYKAFIRSINVERILSLVDQVLFHLNRYEIDDVLL